MRRERRRASSLAATRSRWLLSPLATTTTIAVAATSALATALAATSALATALCLAPLAATPDTALLYSIRVSHQPAMTDVNSAHRFLYLFIICYLVTEGM